MSFSKTIPYALLAFVVGIFADSFLNLPQVSPRGFLFSILLFLIISFLFLISKKQIFAAVFLCLIFLIFGAYRHQSAIIIQDRKFISQYYDKKVILKGAVIKEPERGIAKTALYINAYQISLINDSWQDISTKVLVSAGLYPQYRYGDELEIKGKLLEPVQFETFDYRAYLAKDEIYSVIYYPEIKIIGQNKGNWFYGKIFSFKNKIREVFNQTLAPPYNSVLKAFFLGDGYILSDDFKTRLNITGTRHFIAISGMHMVVMAQILLYLALGVGLWRGQAFYFVLIILVLYIVMVGAPSSAVRAGVMAGLVLLAQKTGRLNSSGRAIVLSAAVMLILNPLLLKLDAGFQLSFIATLSIIYLKPILDQKVLSWPNPIGLKDALIMTLSAQIGTLPLVIFLFGQFSIISILVNVLIVPLSSFLMIAGLILGAVGLASISLAKIIAWPIWLALTYIIKTIGLFSEINFGVFHLPALPVIILVAYYVILVAVVMRWRVRQKII